MNKFYLENDELIIRPPKISDLDSLYELQSDIKVMGYIINGTRTLAGVKNHLLQMIRNYHDHGFTNNIIIRKADNAFMGRGGIITQTIDGKKQIEMGTAFLPKFWRQGYGTKATSMILDWAKDNLSDQYEYMHYIVHKKNLGSIGVARKLGLQQIKHFIHHDWMPAILFRGSLK